MTTLPTIENWHQWQGEFTHLPAVSVCPCECLPQSWLPFWRGSACSALLETGKAGRYTILAPEIQRLLVAHKSSAEVLLVSPEDGRLTIEDTLIGSPLQVLRRFSASFTIPPLSLPLPFTGGMIGFFSYDLNRLLEHLPTRAEDDLQLPLAAWGVADRFYVFDHGEKRLFAIVLQEVPAEASAATRNTLFNDSSDTLARMRRQWVEACRAPELTENNEVEPPFLPTFAPLPDRRFSLQKEEFTAAVLKVQEFIRSGDTYQVNLSVRETRPLHTAPEQVYEALRRINPSPYMALLRLPGFTLVSGSPELLVRMRAGRIEARPIAGTRPRGANEDEDNVLAAELVANEKERAEHLMLVDLIRNDIGRVSRFGTVRVPEFMSVEKYSHVMHIVSHIEGELAEGKDPFDVIAATFPGGTITGAPKVRTMEIIEELEPVRRGPYTGSIGWIGFDGEMDLNITIRTLLATGGEAHVQAGAGIVIDSDPEREYEESLNKARALWAAVEASEAKLAPVAR